MVGKCGWSRPEREAGMKRRLDCQDLSQKYTRNRERWINKDFGGCPTFGVPV